jgi:transcriptional regulator with XRE-family HTH domain
MSIYFSEKFKRLRKDRDLTQEQIADIFHVSPKCVSRWETGANYPDVETLPHIAIFFKVTLDELLGTAEILSEEKANEYTRDIRNLLNSGKLYDAIDLARKAIKEYPLNYGLQGLLIQALSTACDEKSSENFEKYKSEIITVGERAINNKPDELWIKWQLITQYSKPEWNMKEEAKKIVQSLPSEAYFTQDYTWSFVLEGEEWLKNQKNRIIRFWVILHDFISAYVNKTVSDSEPLRKIECRKAMGHMQESISSIISTEEERAAEVSYLEQAFGNISYARLYCEAGDKYIENALEYLEKGTQDSLHHIEQMDKTNADGSNYFAWETPRNLPWVLWEDHLSKPQFDNIRDHERFIKCFKLLKANSQELKQ